MAVDRTLLDVDGPLFRLTVGQYHAMRDAGILGEDDRVELLDGLLVPKMTKKPPHTLATGLVREALRRALPDGYHLGVQDPVTTSDSEPEPDVMVVRGEMRDYGDRHPGPGDVPLIVEVADSSLRLDRGLKLSIYARAAVACYWIVNLRGRVIETFADPVGGTYSKRVDHAADSEIPVVLDGREVARIRVATLLP